LDFRNEPVDPASLPAWEDVELVAVERRFAVCRFVLVAGQAAVVALALGLLPPVEALPPIGDVRAALAVLAAGLVLAGAAWCEARRRGWALREHDLIHRSGLVVRTTTIAPIARLQHVETVSGPLERAFGLVRLACYTAGGLSSDLVVAGLDRETAERVRRFLLGRIHELDGVGPDDA